MNLLIYQGERPIIRWDRAVALGAPNMGNPRSKPSTAAAVVRVSADAYESEGSPEDMDTAA